MAPNNNYNNKGNFSQNRNNNGNKGYQNHNNGSAKKEAQSFPYKQLSESDYVETAQQVVLSLPRKNIGKKTETFELTTSQIRNLLAMTSEILNKINSCKGEDITTQKLPSSIVQYLNSLKIRSVYESGRQKEVKVFINNAHIIEHLNEIKNITDCELFCHYMEALVAYHRFHGGNDK